MEQINYANARSQFSKVMERVLLGYAVKITRKEKDAVVLISEKAYLEYKNAMFELRDGSNQSTYHSQELILLTAKHYTLEDLMASNAFIH
ncbi:type II toxin-antitoxin system Phd/YefM family antitoxin [Acinetobacter baumannii]